MITHVYDTIGEYSLSVKPGIYKIECWGASGGSLNAKPSKGAYISGYISFFSSRDVFIFVGEKGYVYNTSVTFNGGGSCAYRTGTTNNHAASGGGASDVRLISNGNWSDFESLKSRIIVAAGGGGEADYSGGLRPAPGGDGGIIEGFKGQNSSIHTEPSQYHVDATGGTQTSGGKPGGYQTDASHPDDVLGNPGDFGSGGTANYPRTPYSSGGGGSGYFGGGAGGVTVHFLGSGAGGSSYISGGNGFRSITMNSTYFERYFQDNIHYSGLRFHNIVYKTGNDNPYSGNGKVVITEVFYFSSAEHMFTRLNVFATIYILSQSSD